MISSPMSFAVLRCLYSTASARYKRPARGLYAGRGLLFGNTISEFRNKTRRTWKPNVQRCSLYSQVLGEKIRTNATTTALKRIDYAGGLDNYILGQKLPESLLAAKIKSRIIDRLFVQELNDKK